MKPEPEPEELKEELDNSIGDAASLLANLRSAQKQPIPTGKDGLKRQFINELQPIVQRMQRGMTQILEFLTSPSSHDPQTVTDEITQQLCQIAAIASVMSDNPQEYLLLLARDKTLKDIFGLTDETIEKLYQGAKFLYEQQNYVEAAASFSVLSCICPNNHIFWIGLGNSEYFCQNFQAAVMAYALAAHANPNDPLCHFFSARCYEALKQKEHAISSLELALIAIGDKKEFMDWKQRAQEHKLRLSKQA